MVLSLKSCCLAFCACPILAARGVWNSTARKAEQSRDFFPSAIRLGGLILARPEPPMSMGQHMVTAKRAEEQWEDREDTVSRSFGWSEMQHCRGCEACICNMAIGWQYQAMKVEEAEKSAGAFLQRWSMAATLYWWMREKGEASGLPENVEEGTLSWCSPSSCHSPLAQPPLLFPDPVLCSRRFFVLFLFCSSQPLIKV